MAAASLDFLSSLRWLPSFQGLSCLPSALSVNIWHVCISEQWKNRPMSYVPLLEMDLGRDRVSEKFTLEQIRRFWTESALKHVQSHVASWSDRMAIEMEVREIVKHLGDG